MNHNSILFIMNKDQGLVVELCQMNENQSNHVKLFPISKTTQILIVKINNMKHNSIYVNILFIINNQQGNAFQLYQMNVNQFNTVKLFLITKRHLTLIIVVNNINHNSINVVILFIMSKRLNSINTIMN